MYHVASSTELPLIPEALSDTGKVRKKKKRKCGVFSNFFGKAEKKPDMVRDRERLQQYRKQLEVYAHLVEERTGHRVSRTHLYYTGEESGNPFVTWEKDSKSIERTIAEFDTIVSRIEERDYRMKARPGKKCEDCDMRSYCDMKNWTFLEG